jgi:hypothetical protein
MGIVSVQAFHPGHRASHPTGRKMLGWSINERITLSRVAIVSCLKALTELWIRSCSLIQTFDLAR